MACEECLDCTCAKCLPACVDAIVIGTITPTDQNVYVYFQNAATGRIDRFSETSSGMGLVTVDLTGFTPMTNTSYSIWITQDDATSIYSYETITIGSDTATCLATEFLEVLDSYVAVNYPSLTIELCSPSA